MVGGGTLGPPPPPLGFIWLRQDFVDKFGFRLCVTFEDLTTQAIVKSLDYFTQEIHLYSEVQETRSEFRWSPSIYWQC